MTARATSATCLDGLQRQTVSRDHFNLLLVDRASSPEAAAELADMAADHDARLIRLDRLGVNLARNAGAWAARTQFIAYIDDDAIPARDWVEKYSSCHRSGRPAPGPHWWPDPAEMGGATTLLVACLAARRAVDHRA